ncbi:MAG: AAA family ATPase [Agitococcus sp.]|nr:AAA family ATPase [Agitococcus sp.]
MIKSVKIESYKSIQELEVDVGRFNVIIGENGAGKSNFLEALALFGAAEADKLDNEFLSSRGIRACAPKRMFSLFESENTETINISLNHNDNKNYHKHILKSSNETYQKLIRVYPTTKHQLEIKKLMESLEEIEKNWSERQHKINKSRNSESFSKKILELRSLLMETNNSVYLDTIKISDFLLYSPENTALRNFYREGQIEPLGINGEGLLKLLKVMQETEAEAFKDVIDCLTLFDWFETIDIPQNLSSLEDKVSIKDKYLTTLFDQRSANEGFLFVLFYAALFCSQFTPKIFAIDNIDASFNPKLCTVLIKKLVELAKKYDKQVFVTTHNPAILDGIDLNDEEQRLLIASRNLNGHTQIDQLKLTDKQKISPTKLSEAFLRGYIGGLPENF